jgi:hypothetical protein
MTSILCSKFLKFLYVPSCNSNDEIHIRNSLAVQSRCRGAWEYTEDEAGNTLAGHCQYFTQKTPPQCWLVKHQDSKPM